MINSLVEWLARINMAEDLSNAVAQMPDYYPGDLIRVEMLVNSDVYVGNVIKYYLDTIAFTKGLQYSRDQLQTRLENSEDFHSICFFHLEEASGLDVEAEVSANFLDYLAGCGSYFSEDGLEDTITSEREFLVHGALKIIKIEPISLAEVEDIPVYKIEARQVY